MHSLAIAIALLVVAVGRADASPADLRAECDAARGKAPVQAAPLAYKASKHSEPIRAVILKRFVQCGYTAGTLVNAIETIYLQVDTQDRGDVQFDTKNPQQTTRYYVECEGAVRATRADLRAGFVASWNKTFTLPCVHRIYRVDGAGTDRVTGAYTYRPQQATFEVVAVKGGKLEFRFDVTVANPFETLHLQAEASGPMPATIQVFDCSPPKENTRPLRPDVCN
jgi:hypothetical protein